MIDLLKILALTALILIVFIGQAYLTVWLISRNDLFTMNGKPNPKYNPSRFLAKVAEVEKAYPNDKDFPTVLASSKYPFSKDLCD